MMIILPDWKIKTVLLGEDFLMITAGNRFLLYLAPSIRTASSFKLRFSSPLSTSQKETTFWILGYIIVRVG